MGLISMFKRPKAPQAAAPTETTVQAPTVDQAAQQAEDQQRIRKRRGRASYMLSQQGNAGQPNVGTKTLTGQ